MPIKMPKGACLARKPVKAKTAVFLEYRKGSRMHGLSFPSRQEATDYVYERVINEMLVPVYAYEVVGEKDMGYLKVTVTISTLGELTVRITKP